MGMHLKLCLSLVMVTASAASHPLLWPCGHETWCMAFRADGVQHELVFFPVTDFFSLSGNKSAGATNSIQFFRGSTTMNRAVSARLSMRADGEVFGTVHVPNGTFLVEGRTNDISSVVVKVAPSSLSVNHGHSSCVHPSVMVSAHKHAAKRTRRDAAAQVTAPT